MGRRRARELTFDLQALQNRSAAPWSPPCLQLLASIFAI